MLAAALPLCVPGAPLKDPSTDPTPAESSGEEDEEEGIVKTWRTVISFAERHKKEGLLKYTVLLKHVDREYHNSSIVTGVTEALPRLIKQIIANVSPH
ncbi:hypothetical protein GOODEAATRI_018560 [Goodea atripinnis]|uniref:Uncharacterized protein n=1 Tax=Goodea atripinnis TaxID=208336 RepID=A0ABV0P5X5_9TELE